MIYSHFSHPTDTNHKISIAPDFEPNTKFSFKNMYPEQRSSSESQVMSKHQKFLKRRFIKEGVHQKLPNQNQKEKERKERKVK